MNEIRLLGDVVAQPKFSHKKCGRSMYEVFISTKRLSGYVDVVRCIVPEHLVEEFYADRVGIIGEIRTRELKRKKKSRLDIYVRVKATYDCADKEDFNFVNICGMIADRQPHLRETPLGKVILDIFVVSERAESNNIDYLPCIVWGDLAFDSWDLEPGDRVCIGGRLQRRYYMKRYDDGTEEEKFVYEVSVSTLVREEQEMLRVCNECVSCGKEPCLGDSCPNRNVVHMICDKCKDDVDDLYATEDGDLCAECVLGMYEKVRID